MTTTEPTIATDELFTGDERIVVIIPCGAEKVDAPAAARDLYVGNMFATALRTAQSDAFGLDPIVYVLSAKHGLLRLDDEVAPYDVKMGGDGSVDPATVCMQAAELDIDEADEVYTLLPRAYYEVADRALRPLGVYAQDVYEACPGIGYQRGALRCARWE